MLIKICGIKKIEEIRDVNRLEIKPDFVGFVFAESRRKVTKKKAVTLKHALDGSIKTVGVFRNNPVEFVAEIANSSSIDYIQLHGNETDYYIRKLKKMTKLPIIKVNRDSRYARFALYDGVNPGSGERNDYAQVRSNKKYFLAGGININTIDDAINTNPYAIDVSSGVEKNGKKNYKLMKELIERVKR